jgi:hypothetical protein
LDFQFIKRVHFQCPSGHRILKEFTAVSCFIDYEFFPHSQTCEMCSDRFYQQNQRALLQTLVLSSLLDTGIPFVSVICSQFFDMYLTRVSVLVPHSGSRLAQDQKTFRLPYFHAFWHSELLFNLKTYSVRTTLLFYVNFYSVTNLTVTMFLSVTHGSLNNCTTPVQSASQF